jgi:transcriptional regulator with GAF, ATPase, and Fis domain
LTILYICKSRQHTQLKFLYDRKSAVNNILISVSEELNNFHDINILYNQLLESTLDLIEGAEAGSILIYNPDGDYMEFKAAVGYNLEELKELHLKKEELFLYNTNGLKYPDIIKNPLAFDRKNLRENNFEKLVSSNSLNIKCTMCAPLYVNGGFYGLINVDNRNSENAFKRNDINLIKYIDICSFANSALDILSKFL